MRYRWLGWAHSDVYQAADLPGIQWRAGEVYDIPHDAADRLSATFPEYFVEVDPVQPPKRSKRGR